MNEKKHKSFDMSSKSKKTTTYRTKFTPTTLRKLEDAFSYGLSNREACFLANISESLFYEVCQKNPELSERFRRLKDSPKIAAKKVVVNKIREGDSKLACWYLERYTDKKPNQTEPINLSEESRKRLEKYLN